MNPTPSRWSQRTKLRVSEETTVSQRRLRARRRARRSQRRCPRMTPTSRRRAPRRPPRQAGRRGETELTRHNRPRMPVWPRSRSPSCHPSAAGWALVHRVSLAATRAAAPASPRAKSAIRPRARAALVTRSAPLAVTTRATSVRSAATPPAERASRRARAAIRRRVELASRSPSARAADTTPAASGRSVVTPLAGHASPKRRAATRRPASRGFVDPPRTTRFWVSDAERARPSRPESVTKPRPPAHARTAPFPDSALQFNQSLKRSEDVTVLQRGACSLRTLALLAPVGSTPASESGATLGRGAVLLLGTVRPRNVGG